MFQRLLIAFAFALAYVLDMVGLQETPLAVLAMAAPAAPKTPAPEKPAPEPENKRLTYNPENKGVIAVIKEAGKLQTSIMAGKRKLADYIGAHYAEVAAEYNGPFAKWCERNQVSHTRAAFLRYTIDPSFPMHRDDKTVDGGKTIPGYAEHPLYYALSGLMQQAKTVAELEDKRKQRTAQVDAKIKELVGKGMAVAEAEEKAEEEIPAIGTSTRDRTAGTTLARYQKAFAMVAGAMSETPRQLAVTVLASAGIDEKSAARFLSEVLPKHQGHPAVKTALNTLFSKWVVEHSDKVVRAFLADETQRVKMFNLITEAGFAVTPIEKEKPKTVTVGHGPRTPKATPKAKAKK